MEYPQLKVNVFGYHYLLDLQPDHLEGKVENISIELQEMGGQKVLDRKFVSVKIVDNRLKIL